MRCSHAAEAARAASRDGEPGSVVDLRGASSRRSHPVARRRRSVPPNDKVGWLREVDDAARALGAEVRQVIGVYADSVQRLLIATVGRWVEEVAAAGPPRWRQVVRRATGTSRPDSTVRQAWPAPSSSRPNPPSATAEVAARRAITMLDAEPAPAGETSVVLAPGMGGVLFHEAVGHPLEADIVDKEASVYRGRIGERLASEILSGVDDATVPNAWGSFSFDDEGTPAQRTVLFEEGELQGWLYDRLRAEKDGAPRRATDVASRTPTHRSRA